VNERAERERAEAALARLGASYETTVRALAAALELRDDATGSHAARVTEVALRLTARVAPELSSESALAYGFLLHDVGKIGIPDSILRKPGPLDPGELALMRTHPRLGEPILAGIPHLSGIALQVVAYHHESWDGRGYPDGLSGEEIPLAARIFTVADSFDAMTNDRPYRKALPFDEACRRLREASGTQFEPRLVEGFLGIADSLGPTPERASGGS
jgi:ribonuclease P protein subunit RPR2